MERPNIEDYIDFLSHGGFRNNREIIYRLIFWIKHLEDRSSITDIRPPIGEYRELMSRGCLQHNREIIGELMDWIEELEEKKKSNAEKEQDHA